MRAEQADEKQQSMRQSDSDGLVEAAKDGDVKQVEKLLSGVANGNAADNDGPTNVAGKSEEKPLYTSSENSVLSPVAPEPVSQFNGAAKVLIFGNLKISIGNWPVMTLPPRSITSKLVIVVLSKISILPSMALPPIWKYCNFAQFRSDGGRLPSILFLKILKSFILVNFDKDAGIVPSILLNMRCSFSKEAISPSSSGICPEISLLPIRKFFKFAVLNIGGDSSRLLYRKFV